MVMKKPPQSPLPHKSRKRRSQKPKNRPSEKNEKNPMPELLQSQKLLNRAKKIGPQKLKPRRLSKITDLL
jgi:hypothetical protein